MDASTWATIEEIFRDLLIFVAFMIVLLIGLVVIISMLPADNPLKRTLHGLKLSCRCNGRGGSARDSYRANPRTRRDL